jgi:hypothetical protein
MHKDRTIHDWKRVIFSNETRINWLCCNGISWCWICNKKNLPIYIDKQTIKHGRGLVMLWTYLLANRVGSLYKIEQTLNAVCYFEFLQERLYNTLINFVFDLHEVIFQQDNASIHKAKIVQEWL